MVVADNDTQDDGRSPYGRSLTRRLTIPGFEEALHSPTKIHNHGSVSLIDYMGGDPAVVDAARISYGKGTRKVSEDRGLVRYLLRHEHTTPFEMVELKWQCKMPIFVARQWIRHRTANVNEYSLRYSEPRNEFYAPALGSVQFQSVSNKQGRAETEVPADLAARVIELVTRQADEGMKGYEEMNKAGIARELARIGLPLSTYTEWVWKNDLHNTLRFLKLRLHPHAQREIRDYASVMAQVIEKGMPHVWEAFEDYHLDAVSLTRPDQLVVQQILLGTDPAVAVSRIGNKREQEEFMAKWDAIRTRTPERKKTS